MLSGEKDGQAIVKFVDPDGFLYDWTFAEGGSDITLPAEPTKAGFTFRGWERENGDVFGAGQTVTVNGAPGEVIVFTAKWEGAALHPAHIQSRNASGKLTEQTAQPYDIPDDSVASIVAGEPVELTVNPDADYVVSSVYYTTKVGAVTNKVLIEADENGVYRFTMPGADAWLHIETMRERLPDQYRKRRSCDCYGGIAESRRPDWYGNCWQHGRGQCEGRRRLRH